MKRGTHGVVAPMRFGVWLVGLCFPLSVACASPLLVSDRGYLMEKSLILQGVDVLAALMDMGIQLQQLSVTIGALQTDVAVLQSNSTTLDTNTSAAMSFDIRLTQIEAAVRTLSDVVIVHDRTLTNMSESVLQLKDANSSVAFALSNLRQSSAATDVRMMQLQLGAAANWSALQTRVTAAESLTPGSSTLVNAMLQLEAANTSTFTRVSSLEAAVPAVVANLSASIAISRAQTSAFKNRIINGAMAISQRYQGNAFTITGDNVYVLDMFRVRAVGGLTNSYISVQQNAGNVQPPPGFSYYLGMTALAAYPTLNLTNGDGASFIQQIEWGNLYDFEWGTPQALPVTLSFWVRVKVTGIYSGSFRNDIGSRSLAFNYSVSVADQWTQISMTVPGDTDGVGAWASSPGDATAVDGSALRLTFTIAGSGKGGVGNQYIAAVGTYFQWHDSNTGAVAEQVNMFSAAGNYFYITGIQLERSPVQTAFDMRSTMMELAMCQRYFFALGYAQMGNADIFASAQYNWVSTQVVDFFVSLPVPMRNRPTLSIIGAPYVQTGSTLINQGGWTWSAGSAWITQAVFNGMSSTAHGLANGQSAMMRLPAGAALYISAELF